MRKTTYETILGYFVQDTYNAETEGPIQAIPPRLGLRDESPDRWDSLLGTIKRLNCQAPEIEGGVATAYKLIFFIRHGQALHNIAKSKHGKEAWKSGGLSKANGDGKLTWGPDPGLTPKGIEEAFALKKACDSELKCGFLFPKKNYSSPLLRGLMTCKILFGGVGLLENKRPIVLENCRERHGENSTSKRKNRSDIEEAFGETTFEFERGFKEEDPLWRKDVRESWKDVVERASRVLDVIFANDEQVVSVTTHSQMLKGFRLALGMKGTDSFPKFPTGAVYPVIVKAIHTPENLSRVLHA